MAGMRIRAQSLSQRCEVCHQADRFDAATNRCQRCGNLAMHQLLLSSNGAGWQVFLQMLVGLVRWRDNAGQHHWRLLPALTIRYWQPLLLLSVVLCFTLLGALIGGNQALFAYPQSTDGAIMGCCVGIAIAAVMYSILFFDRMPVYRGIRAESDKPVKQQIVPPADQP